MVTIYKFSRLTVVYIVVKLAEEGATTCKSVMGVRTKDYDYYCIRDVYFGGVDNEMTKPITTMRTPPTSVTKNNKLSRQSANVSFFFFKKWLKVMLL